MKRWWIAFGLVMLACLSIFLQRSISPNLFVDTDTAVLLETIRERNAPLSWFTGDWPLQNHFYRPISTLTFEFDNAVWGDNPAGYGLTNALLCIGCVLLLFWFLRELSDKPGMAAAGAVLFALWTTNDIVPIAEILPWLVWLPLIGLVLPGRARWQAVAAGGLVLFLSQEVFGMWPLDTRMLNWLPGRTASTMAVFALAALAAYARYERLSAKVRSGPEPSALDLPDYKRTVEARRPKMPWLWALLSCLCVALALGSYEQAVMVPATLLGVALVKRWQGFRVRLGWQAAFFGLLAAYLALRWSILPHDASGYQQQQFRDGPGVIISLLDYLLPVAVSLRNFGPLLIEQGPIVLLIGQAMDVYAGLYATVSTLNLARKQWVLPLAGWALSFLAFLPMAWLKHFEHYHFWPMAMRAAMVAAMIPIAIEAVKSALSPRAVQAPLRLDPAPGSLLHP